MEVAKDISYDLCVIAGPADADQDGFRASSKALASTSPVFAAMFGPNFSEGQKLRDPNRTEPVSIALPDDDPVVMRLLCDAVCYDDRATTSEQNFAFWHGLCDTVLGDPADAGQLMKLPLLAEYAAAVDKYYCREAVRCLTVMLLSRDPSNMSCFPTDGTVEQWNTSIKVLLSLRESEHLSSVSQHLGRTATDQNLADAVETAQGDALLKDFWHTIISARKLAYRTLTRTIDKYVRGLDALNRAREKDGPKALRQERDSRVCHCGIFDKRFDDAFNRLQKVEVLDKRQRRGKNYDKLLAKFRKIGRDFHAERTRTSPGSLNHSPSYYEPIGTSYSDHDDCRDIFDLFLAEVLESRLKVQGEHWPSHDWTFVGFCLECHDGGDRRPDEWRKWKDIYFHQHWSEAYYAIASTEVVMS